MVCRNDFLYNFEFSGKTRKFFVATGDEGKKNE